MDVGDRLDLPADAVCRGCGVPLAAPFEGTIAWYFTDDMEHDFWSCGACSARFDAALGFPS
jgi:rubredoxin